MFHGPLGIQTRDYTLKPEYRAGLKTAVGTLKLLKKTERDLDIDSFVDDRFIREAAANLALDYDARLKSYDPLPLTATDATTHEPIAEPRLAAQVWVGGEDAVRSYASIRHALEALALIESGGKKARIVYVHDRTTGLKLLASTAWYAAGDDAIAAFLLRSDAETWARQHRGRVRSFDELRQGVVEAKAK
jgi:NitT/TauT family transport system substrate-binding protein